MLSRFSRVPADPVSKRVLKLRDCAKVQIHMFFEPVPIWGTKGGPWSSEVTSSNISLDFEPIQGQFWRFEGHEHKENKKERYEKKSENQGVRATSDNSFHHKAGCPSAVAGLVCLRAEKIVER